MIDRVCSTCGEWFEAKGHWQKLCWDCWRRERDEKIRTEGYLAGKAAGSKVIPPKTLRAAVALCHPDRHPPERRVEANRVTAELLELRDT